MGYAFLDHHGILAFAHRGDHESGPENTMPAFAGAVSKGFDYLETDVHCSDDDVLLAFHDHQLDRVTDMTGMIAQQSYASIRQARVAGLEPIPRLEELFSAFPSTRFNIDLKADNSLLPFIKLVRKSGCQDRICVGSFSDARLSAFRQEFPRVCTSMGPREVLRARLASFDLPVGSLTAGCAQVPVRHKQIPIVDFRFVRAMKARSIQTHVWTINSVDQMNHLLDVGVDGIMTDYPSRLKQVLIKRGLWNQASS
jgi:glycerophosphoryl diester phosphodiesterase